MKRPPRSKTVYTSATFRVSYEVSDYEVSGYVVFGDWEGDPAVDHGINMLPPYVDDLTVITSNAGQDITDDIPPQHIEWYKNLLIETAEELVEAE